VAVPTENLHTDLQEKEWGCASGHVLVDGRGAGKGPGWLWVGTGLKDVCSGDGGLQQSELHSVRSHLVSSVHVTVLIKGLVGIDETSMVAGLCFLCPSLPLMVTWPWAHSPVSLPRAHPLCLLPSPPHSVISFAVRCLQ